MHFPILLIAAIASIPLSHATLADDLSTYLAAHPEQHGVSSSSPKFIDWKTAKSPILPVNSTAEILPVIPKAYIIKLKPGSGLTRRGESAHSLFHKRASDTIDYDTRYEFTDSSLFFGLSIQVNDDANATSLLEIPNVLAVWPVSIFPRPNAVGLANPRTGIYTYEDGTQYLVNATAGSGYNYNSPHKMTDVDRLHDEGIKGKGIKIAIMDTGVDWRHPALGGCFGTGCKISFGLDFVGDDYDATGVAVQDPDPLVTCTEGGHGTHVAGIVGMQDPPNSTFGLVGVAPEADIGMYRVFGCTGGAASDIMMLAFQQAAIDEADILSMSLGSDQQWEWYDYFQDIVAALEAQGIAVVVAAGNSGGLAGYTASPAVGPKAIAVGSVQNSHFPTVYVGKDSKGHTFKYSGNPWPVQAPAAGLKVVDMLKLAADTDSPEGCTQEAWEAAYYAIQDKTNVILALPKGGGCSTGTKLDAAGSFGFLYSVVYAKEDGDVYDLDYSTLPPQPPFYGVTLNVVDGKTLVKGMASDDYKLFFPNTVFDSHTQKTSGMMSYFTSEGPSSDTLTLKPQLSSPGQMILATWPLAGTGYTILSGTSMATPYMSGAFALLKSKFPNATVQQLREIMQSTARSVPYAYDTSIQAFAGQQGSGLINVYNAVHYESSISPSELNLGDLDDLKPREITIENKSSRTKTYIITHEPAAVANILPNQYNMGGNGTIWPSLSGQYASYASVEFSTSTLSVKAGQKSTFTAIFTPPTDIPDRYLPVYSGMIKITNNNDEFTVTYIGQPYSRFKADYIEATNDTGVLLPALLAPGSYDITDAIRDIGVYTFADWTAFPSFDWVTMQSIQYFRVDLVPYNTSFVPNFYGFIKTEDNPQGVPARYLPLQYPNPTELPLLTTDENAGLLETYGIWDDDENLTHPSAFLWGFGNYANGWKLPNGDYRALLRVLRWNGDWLKEKDYQSWLSPVIRVQYK